jgi:hypothetical protein
MPTVSIETTPAPDGGETLVNTYTTNHQYVPAIAVLADGSYVVVWNSLGQDNNNLGVYMQRFDAAGSLLGSETQVHSSLSGEQSTPSVAALAGGGFVVSLANEPRRPRLQHLHAALRRRGRRARQRDARKYHDGQPSGRAVGRRARWRRLCRRLALNGQDGSGYGVYTQRYDAAGNALGGETLVNSETTNSQQNAMVAALAAAATSSPGNRTCRTAAATASTRNATTRPVRQSASETRVNTFTGGEQVNPSVAALADGGYVLVWDSNGQGGGIYDVYMQRYDSAGATVGVETLVTTAADSATSSSVAALDLGGFVVTWTSLDCKRNRSVHAALRRCRCPAWR